MSPTDGMSTREAGSSFKPSRQEAVRDLHVTMTNADRRAEYQPRELAGVASVRFWVLVQAY